MPETTDTTNTAPATPTPEHHANLFTFLQVLLHLAPAIAAPFVKNPNSAAILNAEAPIAIAIADALAPKS